MLYFNNLCKLLGIKMWRKTGKKIEKLSFSEIMKQIQEEYY